MWPGHLTPVLFTLLVSVLVLSIPTALTASVTNVQCTASLTPEVVIVKQFGNETHQKVRCGAEISGEKFSKPNFELSFGLSPTTGVFILRGESKCSPDGQYCWSDFKIYGFALRQLLLDTLAKGESASGDESDALTASSSMTHSPRTSEIEFTCNVADAWRNKRISCSQSASIRFANVLHYGQKCATSTANAESECASNMECLGGRCVCRQSFLPHRLSRREILCLDKASIGERCNFTQQCTAKQSDSVCEHDGELQTKVCKCLSGYEEIKGENGQFHCSKIVLPPPSSSAPTTVTQQMTSGTSPTTASTSTTTTTTTESLTDFELLDSIDDSDLHPPHPPQKHHRDLRSMALALAKSTQFILIATGLCAFLLIMLVAIAIRSKNYGQLEVKKKSKQTSNQCSPPLLGLSVHKVGSDDDGRGRKRTETITSEEDGFGEELEEEEDDEDNTTADADDSTTHRGDSPFLSFESDDITNLHSKQSTV